MSNAPERPTTIVLPDAETVIIPDVHQNIEWLMSIVSSHPEAAQFVLLGDLFDPKRGSSSVSAEFALRYYETLINDHRFHILWGNHDVSVFGYWYGLTYLNDPNHHLCLDWVLSKYRWDMFPFGRFSFMEDLWAKFRPFVKLGPWVLSHAGIHEGLLPKSPTVDDLEELAAECHEQIWNLDRFSEPPPAWQAGESRGGPIGELGGFTWQDFHDEFRDSLPWPQMVGHTPLKRPLKIGRSIGADCKQSFYFCYSPTTGMKLHETHSRFADVGQILKFRVG